MPITISMDQLNSMLEDIDAKLRADQVPVHLREFRGLSTLYDSLGIPLLFGAVAPSDPLSDFVTTWFRDRYGVRAQRETPHVGRYLTLLRHDPHLIRFPLVFGRIEVDVLDYVQDLTPSLRLSLSEKECDSIYEDFNAGIEAWREIGHFPAIPEGDLDAAIDHLLKFPRNHGLSKWASLQAAEKALKTLIRKRGQTPPKVHNLSRLASQATSLGLPEIPSALLADIQCSASVRYDEPVSLEEAVRAHHASVQMIGFLAKHNRSPASGTD